MDVHKTHDERNDAWLTPAEAASLLPGTSAKSVREWILAGKMPGAIQLPGGRYWIPWTTVVSILGFDPRSEDPSPGGSPPDPLPGLEE